MKKCGFGVNDDGSRESNDRKEKDFFWLFNCRNARENDPRTHNMENKSFNQVRRK